MDRAERADVAAPPLVQHKEPQGKIDEARYNHDAGVTEQHAPVHGQLVLQRHQIADAAPAVVVEATGKGGQILAEIDGQVSAIDQHHKEQQLQPEAEAPQVDA